MAKKPTEGRRKLVEFDVQTWHALNVLDRYCQQDVWRPATVREQQSRRRGQLARKLGPRISHFAGFVRQRPTLRPAALPPAGQGGRRQFGSDRGHRQRWKLETLQGRSTPDADHGI